MICIVADEGDSAAVTALSATEACATITKTDTPFNDDFICPYKDATTRAAIKELLLGNPFGSRSQVCPTEHGAIESTG